MKENQPISDQGVEEMTAAARNTEQEKALLKAIARGDRRAFAELYQVYQPRLHAYLRRLLRNPATVEEVVDDVMFVVWKDARKFRGDSATSSWIFGIAYRKAMSAVRSSSRRNAAIDHGADVETIAEEPSRQHELLRVALAELSDDHRQVVELTYFCGFSYQEIAQIADCPVNTVKTRMFHAQRRLKYLLPILAGEKKEQHRGRA